MSEILGDDVTLRNFYTQNGYVEANDQEIGGDSYHLEATNSMTFTGDFTLDCTSGTSFPSYMVFKAPKIIFNTVGAPYDWGISIWNNGKNSVTFLDSSVNFDNAIYETDSTYIGPIAFTGSSSINVTTASNGKMLIKASTLTGTISLDVESGVQDGDTFSIEATTNNLVITDGEWTATPSTVGNVTTYTLAKAGPSIKQRLFYTYENRNKVLRFLRGGL